MYIRYYIFVVLFFLLSSKLSAQTFSATNIRRLSVENGLSNRFVKTVFQDSKGFIWVATRCGLNRYDGYSFKTFTKEKDGLYTDVINNLFEDKDSCLWISYSTLEGKILNHIDIIDLETYELYSLKSIDSTKLNTRNILSIFQTDTQSIFVLMKDKWVYEYLGKGKFQKKFQFQYPIYTLHNILASQQSIWVVGDNYLLEYDHGGNLIGSNTLPVKMIMDLKITSVGVEGFAKSLNDSLVYFVKKDGQALKHQPCNFLHTDIPALTSMSRIKKSPRGLLWYSDKDASRIYNEKGVFLYDFSKHLPEKSIHIVSEVFFDDNDALWIATSNGLYMLNIHPSRFQTYLNTHDFIPNSLAHSIRGITEDEEGFLIVNTYSGRKKINAQTGEIVSEQKIVKGKDLPELDVMKDKSGKIWFCGTAKLVECYDPQTKTTKFYPCKVFERGDNADKYSIMNIKLFEDHRGRIWLGSDNGVYYLDTLHHAFIPQPAYLECERLNHSRVYAFLEDKKEDVLWVGSTTGVYKYDYSEGRFTSFYAATEKAPYRIPYSHILSMHKDAKEDCFWLGTFEGGLIKWYPKKGISRQFTVATGLSDNVIYSILEDEDGALWLGSNYGLMRFDKEKFTVKFYLPSDGITHEEFNVLSSYKSKSGRFYFGGINGFVGFYPKDFKEKSLSQIPIHVVRYDYLSAHAQQLEDQTKKFYKEKVIVLKPYDNFFMLTFALLDYTDPSHNKYAYKIEGLVQDWQYTNENVLRFNRLPYGKYTLKIKAQGYDGRWSKNELSIPIDIQVPFFQTWTFFILLVSLAAVLTILFLWWLIRSNEQNKKRLEREVTSRTQMLLEREQDLVKAKEDAEKSSQAKAEFLSVMSHEIRTPMNAVVNLTNYLLDDNPRPNQAENLKILKFSANNLLAIINDVLDFSKIESGKVDFENIDFDLLIILDNIHYVMGSNAKAKGIQFLLDVKANLSCQLKGDPNRLIQILNNLISNAIKFTENGTVCLKITTLSEDETKIHLLFEIEDTGIGITEKEKEYIFNMFTQAASHTTRKYGGTGLGLAITKRLLQLQNSEIRLQSKVGEGSVFSFALNFEKGAVMSVKEEEQINERDFTGKLQGIKVLVVEDNAVNVLVVKKFLKKWGVDITHAVDGQDAVEKAQKEVFDLILMDIHMPVMDGYMAAQEIRNLNGDYYQQVPIIALTASALIDNKERVFKVGMNDIVVKPFKPEELYKILTKYLQKN